MTYGENNLKFLKLTESFANGGTTDLIINAGQISSIKVSDRGKDSHISMTGGKYFFIRETVEEIFDMLHSITNR